MLKGALLSFVRDKNHHKLKFSFYFCVTILRNFAFYTDRLFCFSWCSCVRLFVCSCDCKRTSELQWKPERNKLKDGYFHDNLGYIWNKFTSMTDKVVNSAQNDANFGLFMRFGDGINDIGIFEDIRDGIMYYNSNPDFHGRRTGKEMMSNWLVFQKEKEYIRKVLDDFFKIPSTYCEELSRNVILPWCWFAGFNGKIVLKNGKNSSTQEYCLIHGRNTGMGCSNKCLSDQFKQSYFYKYHLVNLRMHNDRAIQQYLNSSSICDDGRIVYYNEEEKKELDTSKYSAITNDNAMISSCSKCLFYNGNCKHCKEYDIYNFLVSPHIDGKYGIGGDLSDEGSVGYVWSYIGYIGCAPYCLHCDYNEFELCTTYDKLTQAPFAGYKDPDFIKMRAQAQSAFPGIDVNSAWYYSLYSDSESHIFKYRYYGEDGNGKQFTSFVKSRASIAFIKCRICGKTISIRNLFNRSLVNYYGDELYHWECRKQAICYILGNEISKKHVTNHYAWLKYVVNRAATGKKNEDRKQSVNNANWCNYDGNMVNVNGISVDLNKLVDNDNDTGDDANNVVNTTKNEKAKEKEREKDKSIIEGVVEDTTMEDCLA